jgi:uncharacterized protein YdiU (UPF0061 family)
MIERNAGVAPERRIVFRIGIYLGDVAPFEQLLEVVLRPFVERPGYERYTASPAPEERVQQTFCGT